jgi:hypothetical protein
MSTTSTDIEHLRLLSIFHYIVAGLTALFSLFPLIHLAIGIGLISGALDEQSGEAEVVGWVFVVFAILWIACGFALATCIAFAGKCLKLRRNYRFCFVVACVSCVFMPIGTILGVFTILVLSRPSVKSAFGA